jgi:hypothetical protein
MRQPPEFTQKGLDPRVRNASFSGEVEGPMDVFMFSSGDDYVPTHPIGVLSKKRTFTVLTIQVVAQGQLPGA